MSKSRGPESSKLEAALAKGRIKFDLSPLINQPTNILIDTLHPDLTVAEKVLFSRTAEEAHRLFQPKLDKTNVAYLLKHFGELVIKGNQAAVAEL